jgi:hypothetical protein
MKLVVTLLSIFSLTAYAAANRKIDAGTVEFKQQATPSTPASGYNRVYAKPDGKVYNLTSAGVEAELGAGGGGAKNYIQNPNAATDATTGVTYTNVTSGRDSTGGLFEDTNFSFTIDSATDVVSFAADAFDPYLQNTGLCQAEFTWTADANGENVQAQVFRNGAVIGQKNLYTTGATSPATASIAFLCGDLVNATTFRIVGTAATTTALKLSQVKLTEAQWSKDPVGSTWVGSIKWSGASGCAWNVVSNQTWTNFPADSDCNNPVVKGSLVAPSTKVPGFQLLDADPNSVYVFEMRGGLDAASSNQVCGVRFTDGTVNTSMAMFGYPSADQFSPGFDGEYIPASTGTKNIIAQASGVTGNASCYIDASASFREAEITVTKYPRDQAVVNLKAQSGDYDALAYSPTITGLGAITDAAFTHERKNGVLTVKGTFTTVTPTGVYATISLPGSLQLPVTVNGRSNLESALGPDVGRYRTNVANQIGNILTATGTSRSVVYFGDTMNVAGGLTPRFGSTFAGSGVLYSVEFTVPIQGWTKSNTAVNIAGEPGAWNGKHDYTCVWGRSSTTVGPYGATATCGFSQLQNVNFGTVVSQRSGSDYLPGIVFTPKLTGAFMACPTGHVSTNGEGTIRLLANSVEVWSLGANSTSYTPVGKCGSFAAVVGTPVTLEIQGASTSGSSFISGLGSGTTNRSASIEWTIFPITQNLPGLLGGGGGGTVVYRAAIGRTTETGDCNASPCTVYISAPNTTWITSATRASAGNYTVNFNSGTFTNSALCTAVASNSIRMMRVIRSGTSSVNIISYNDAGSPSDTAFNIHCVDGGT